MRNFGYVGYCHVGKPRVWAESFEDCKTQAKEFMDANAKYLTRKGIFIYKLAEKKELIKRIQNVD